MAEGVLERFNAGMQGRLPGLLGVELLHIERGRVEGRLELRPELLAPNEFLHAGVFRCTQFLLPREDPRTSRQQEQSARLAAAARDDQEVDHAG